MQRTSDTLQPKRWHPTEDEVDAVAAARRPRFVVVTGAPCAGKSAVLATLRYMFCSHVRLLPSSAALLTRGFPSDEDDDVRRCAEMAVFHVQRALERAATVNAELAVVVCDRGTLDVLPYWPGNPADLFLRARTTMASELARYRCVIHLRTPAERSLADDTPAAAAAIDEKVAAAWQSHPRVCSIDGSKSVLEKARLAASIIEAELPENCRICSTFVPHTYQTRIENLDRSELS